MIQCTILTDSTPRPTLVLGYSRIFATRPYISTTLLFRILCHGIGCDRTPIFGPGDSAGAFLQSFLTRCHIFLGTRAKGSILQMLLLVCFSKQVFRALAGIDTRVPYQCMRSPKLVPYGNDAIVNHCSCNIVVNFKWVLDSEQISLPDFLGLGTRPAQVNNFCLSTCPPFRLFGYDAANCAQREGMLSPPAHSKISMGVQRQNLRFVGFNGAYNDSLTLET